jgi:hypothetical protein
MSALSIQPVYPIFTDIDGQPLEDGFVWIGQANLDPQVNPINVYWDAALTIPAGQPIRTLGGYPANSGTPARLYVNSDYSIRVMNKNGSVVYSAPAATERYSDAVISAVNAEDVVYDPPFANAVQTNVEAKLAQTVSIKDFGAVGDGVTDDTAAIQAAIDAVALTGGTLIFPTATYVFSPASVQVGGSTGRSQFSHTAGIFDSLTGVAIDGQGSKIVYSGTFYYGYFSGSFVPTNESSGGVPFTPPGFARFTNCENAEIRNLTIDGPLTSSSATVVFGGTGTDVRQIGGIGIYFANNDVASANNVSVSGMLFDGFYVNQSAANSVTEMLNCKAYRCNRQGLTIAGSQQFTAIDCAFEETGRGNYGAAAVSPPSSCVDIESEGGEIKNVTFINCKLHNSTGRSLEFFVSGGNPISQVKFYGGQISGPGGITTPPVDTLFDSVLVATFVFSNRDNTQTVGVLPTDAVQYRNCKFVRNSTKYNYSGAWFTANSCTGGLFDGCLFENEDATFVAQTMAGTPDSAYTTFKDCRFVDPVATSALGFKGQFTGNISFSANGQNFYTSPTRSCFFECNVNGNQKVIGSTSNNGTLPATNAWFFQGVRYYVGTGDPSGVVFANIGDVFLRTDGSPGATFYVKEANSGFATGWAAK